MQKIKETFQSTLKLFEYHHDLRNVFDDFLTLTLCSFSQNPKTGKSFDEDLYLETIAKYAKSEERHHFPKLLAYLIEEMEVRTGSSEGNDVLGECYEQNFSRRGASQYFTPQPVCTFMASILSGDTKEVRPLRILDPSCGSGRMLLASAKANGPEHRYFGIDIDQTCVKMTTINLFLNGLFHCEVMWANALNPNDFMGAYRTSFLPFGVFRIKEREDSELWWSGQGYRGKQKNSDDSNKADAGTKGGEQLHLF